MELVMKSISCAVTVALLTVANTSLTAASDSTNVGLEKTGQNSGHHVSIFVALTDVILLTKKKYLISLNVCFAV